MTTDERKPEDSQEIKKQEAKEPHRLEQQEINGTLVAYSYEIWKDGVYKRKNDVIPGNEEKPPTPDITKSPGQKHRPRLTKIAGRPAFLCAVGRRIDDDRELIALKYLATSDEFGDRWETLWVTYDQIADNRKLLDLSKDLFPVRSDNAREMSIFLTDSYDANLGILMPTTIVRRAGWHQDSEKGVRGWLVGSRWIGEGCVHPDPNLTSITRALSTQGKLDKWIEFTKEQFESGEPGAWAIRWFLGTSFAAPLLRHLDHRTFFVHHYGQSGGGKTTLAQLGQSVWGHPKDFSLSLNRVTQNSVTEIFRYVSDLPILLDELQGTQINASDFIMQACTETHKERVKQEGGLARQEARGWRTLIRTTGEQTIAGADKTDLGGQANRALEINYDELSVAQASRIYEWLEEAHHFGLAGLDFLVHLHSFLSTDSGKGKLRTRWKDLIDKLQEHLDQDVSQPLKHLAVVALGELYMLHWIYKLPREKAYQVALEDAVTIGRKWTRVKDSATLLERGCSILREHRYAHANQYANLATPEGKMKISRQGTRSASPIVAIETKKEVWYLPEAINSVLRSALSSPPNRFWEELSRKGVLSRGSDRLPRDRQVKDLFKMKVLVVNREAFETLQTDPVDEEPLDLSGCVPGEEEWFPAETQAAQAQIMGPQDITDFDVNPSLFGEEVD